MAEQQPDKMFLNWTAAVPEGYQVAKVDEATHLMVVVRTNEKDGQDISPCPV